MNYKALVARAALGHGVEGWASGDSMESSGKPRKSTTVAEGLPAVA
jgi:hypothetical protein